MYVMHACVKRRRYEMQLSGVAMQSMYEAAWPYSTCACCIYSEAVRLRFAFMAHANQ